MMHPSAMQRLFPDLDESDWPTYGTVEKDDMRFLTKRMAIPLKPTPPPFRNHGNHVTSIARLGRFLGEKAEEAGVYILPETSGYKLLVDEKDQVIGVRTGDKGRGRDGEPLGNFEPGSDVVAKATVLAEGTQGHLAGAAIKHFDLGSGDPQQWELGVKEVWEVAEAARPRDPLARLAAPLGREVPRGRRLVHLPDGRGQGLDGLRRRASTTRDATLSVHDLLQQFKTHPMVRKILEGGKRVAWGAKTIPSGGYWAMPKQLLGAGHGDRGRLRRHGQRPEAEGRPPRDARRHVRGRGDLPAPEGRAATRRTSRTTSRRSRARRSRRTCTARATCARRCRTA